MILDGILWLLLGVYTLAALGLMIYGFNTYVLLFLFSRSIRETRERQKKQEEEFLKKVSESGDEAWPIVTTQLPLYNEYNCREADYRSGCEVRLP